jgi:hypothetical protein
MVIRTPLDPESEIGKRRDRGRIIVQNGRIKQYMSQGPQGNPSTNLRKTLRDHVRAVNVRTAKWVKVSIPESIQ